MRISPASQIAAVPPTYKIDSFNQDPRQQQGNGHSNQGKPNQSSDNIALDEDSYVGQHFDAFA